MFNQKTFTIQRLTVVSGNKKSYQNYGTLYGSIPIPLSAEQSAIAEGAFGKTYKVFAEYGSDVEVGDRLIDGTNEYEVRAVQKFEMGAKHYELLVEESIKQ